MEPGMLNTQGVPSVEGIQSLFFTRNLGMDVVSDLLTFAICRPKSFRMFISDPPSFNLYRRYIYIFTHLYISWGKMSHVLHGLLTSILSQSETTWDPRTLNYRTHFHGYMYFSKEFLCTHALCFTVYMELEWELSGIRLPKFDQAWLTQAEPSFHFHPLQSILLPAFWLQGILHIMM